MPEKTLPPKAPSQEHSVPWFWPFAAALELEEEGMRLYRQNLDFLAEAGELAVPPEPNWATANRVVLELDTMRLRDFGGGGDPVLIDAPYAGHSSTIADYAKGQSLVETLLAAGVGRVLATDWKPATPAMRDYDIDKYLAEINVVVDELGGRANLV
ncbi:MAG: esterase, partial [Burkholderiales bacterium]